MTPEQEKIYEDAFIAGMQKQMQSSVDKAVNRMAQRPWQGLTDAERDEICLGDESIARSIEAKLRDKNGGNHES
jgi:hypothetical protein